MDPVTIIATTASTIKIAYGVSALLYSFLCGTAQIDTTLQSLADELDSLKNAIVAIDACLRSPTLAMEQSDEDENKQELYLSVNLSLNNCQKTLQQFETLLAAVQGNHLGTNSLRKAMMRIKLDLKNSDIQFYRERFSSHASAMQMALQTLTLYTSIQGPDTVVFKLQPKIEALIDLLASFKVPLHGQGATIEDDQTDAIETGESMSRLNSLAQKVISRASTVVSASTIYEGSVLGDQQGLTTYQQARISKWNLETVQEYASRGSSTTEVDQEPDEDDEIEIEMFDNLTKAGQCQIQEGDFTEAEKFFEEARKAANKTSSFFHQHSAVINLALIYFKQKRFDLAKEILSPLLSNPFIVLTLDQVAEVSHILAISHFELQEFKKAELYCNQAMRSQRRLFGKLSPLYIKSVEIRIAICEANGERQLAVGYKSMLKSSKPAATMSQRIFPKALPETERPSFSLSLPKGPPLSDESKLPSERIREQEVTPDIVDAEPQPSEPENQPSESSLISQEITASENGSNPFRVNAIEIIQRGLARMEEAPYFITIRTFDPHAALLAAIHKGDIEIAQILLTRLADVETCHIRHLASNSFQVRRPDFKLINFTGKLDVNCCNGHCLFEACKIVDESIRNDMINMLLTNGADPNIHEKVGPSPLSVAENDQN